MNLVHLPVEVLINIDKYIGVLAGAILKVRKATCESLAWEEWRTAPEVTMRNYLDFRSRQAGLPCFSGHVILCKFRRTRLQCTLQLQFSTPDFRTLRALCTPSREPTTEQGGIALNTFVCGRARSLVAPGCALSPDHYGRVNISHPLRGVRIDETKHVELSHEAQDYLQ